MLLQLHFCCYLKEIEREEKGLKACAFCCLHVFYYCFHIINSKKFSVPTIKKRDEKV